MLAKVDGDVADLLELVEPGNALVSCIAQNELTAAEVNIQRFISHCCLFAPANDHSFVMSGSMAAVEPLPWLLELEA